MIYLQMIARNVGFPVITRKYLPVDVTIVPRSEAAAGSRFDFMRYHPDYYAQVNKSAVLIRCLMVV